MLCDKLWRGQPAAAVSFTCSSCMRVLYEASAEGAVLECTAMAAPRDCSGANVAALLGPVRFRTSLWRFICYAAKRVDESVMTKKHTPHSPPDGGPNTDNGAATADRAEKLRRAAEEIREAAEVRRLEQEDRREAAERTRAIDEGARLSADDARQALVDSVRQTAASLQATLERMTTVEEMRRALHEMRAPGKVDPH